MVRFCVISHTHWDREWYLPREKFRFKLVDLIDKLFEIIEEYPEYIFHLDAQTVIIEDYLEIKPHNKDLLKKYIQSGNILIGPWYLQNDFYLTSGEATVRNLLEGKRISKEFGGYKRYGYTPDQFGNISQLPQILKNFGIDTFVFGRGYSEFFENAAKDLEKIKKPCEFIWQGADGSQLNAFFLAYWYNNAQRFSADIEKCKILLDISQKQFKDINVTPYILLMNGSDHLEAQNDLFPILQKLKDYADIKQCSFPEYFKLVRDYITKNKIQLKIFEGELNKGCDYELLKGCWSSRIYLKTENVNAQNSIENYIEPLYSMLECCGMKGVYPQEHIRYLWKKILKIHPHDNICGCSTDSVNSHMEDSFKKIREISDEFILRGLDIAANHIITKDQNINEYKLTVANTLESSVTTVANAQIEILCDDGYRGIEITDTNGKKVNFAVNKIQKQIQKDIFSPLNLPGIRDVDVYDIDILLNDLKPYSFECFNIVKSPKNIIAKCGAKQQDFVVAENEFFEICASTQKGISVNDLKNSKTIEKFITINDNADRGDSYVFIGAPDKSIIADKPQNVFILQENSLKKTIRTVYNFKLPCGYDFKNSQRSNKQVSNTLTIDLTLKKQCDVIEIDYILENKSKDHRLSLCVNSGKAAKNSYADIPFDIIKNNADSLYLKTKSKTHFNTSFVASEGLGVFTQGCHEYENLENGQIALTLVRSTGAINRNPVNYGIIGGKNWIVEENQALRTLHGKLGIYFYCDNQSIESLYNKAKMFRTPPLIYSAPNDFKKFAGGRTAVQDTRLEEFFYPEDKYKDVNIGCGNSLINISGNVTVSALKKSEDGKDLIVRIINLHKDKQQAEISGCFKFYLTTMEEVKEEYLGKNIIKLNIDAKKIITVKLKHD